MITLKLIQDRDTEYQRIKIESHTDGSHLPAAILKSLKLPEGIDLNCGVIIDGRSPNWLYSYIAFQCRNVLWIGCYYPQIHGAVIIHTQVGGVGLGQVKCYDRNQANEKVFNGHLELNVTERSTTEGKRVQCLEIDGTDLSYEALDSLSLPDDLDWERGIVLWGKAPIWLYVYLVLRCQQAPWIACYNQTTCEAIIVVSQVREFAIGDRFEPVPINSNPAPAIIIGGPPDSGKGVLAYTLKQNLIARQFNNQVYLHRVSWDGEGDWFAELMKMNRELANELSIHGGRFQKPQNLEEYFSQQAISINKMRFYTNLVLVDIGGKPGNADISVLSSCTHYIIISNSPQEIPQWHEFFRQGNLKPLAVIESVKEEKLEIKRTEPYLEIIAGLWEYGSTTVPKILLERVVGLL